MIYGPPLQMQAATAVGGYAKVNGTGTVVSWTAPNDGQQHRALILASEAVGSAETGGAVSINYHTPDGGFSNHTIFGPQAGAANPLVNPVTAVVEAGQTVSVLQSSALTAGGPSTVWAEIWGS